MISATRAIGTLAVTGIVCGGALIGVFASQGNDTQKASTTPSTTTTTTSPALIPIPGPRGAAGAIGPIGPRGPIGPDGPVGPNGSPGQDGIGVAGQDGSPGQQGAAGATGQQGVQGTPGATGTAGSPGAIGQAGQTGQTGQAGATGATGARGPQGATGATGAQGPIGPVGPIGPIGPQGPPITVVAGGVAADGTVAYGIGFTSVRNGVGRYTVTFTTPFAAVPAVVVTKVFGSASVDAGAAVQPGETAVIDFISTSSVIVATGATNGALTDGAFEIIAVAT